MKASDFSSRYRLFLTSFVSNTSDGGGLEGARIAGGWQSYGNKLAVTHFDKTRSPGISRKKLKQASLNLKHWQKRIKRAILGFLWVQLSRWHSRISFRVPQPKRCSGLIYIGMNHDTSYAILKYKQQTVIWQPSNTPPGCKQTWRRSVSRVGGAASKIKSMFEPLLVLI